MRDALAGTGDAHAHSHPWKSFPAASTSIVRLICRRNSSASVRSVLHEQAFSAGREALLAPLPQQAVGDVVLAAQISHRLRSTQRREHDLGLPLGRNFRCFLVSPDTGWSARSPGREST